MKKSTLLICTMIMSLNAQANWQQSISDTWDSAKSSSANFFGSSTEDELSEVSVPKQKVMTSWDEVEEQFGDILDLKDDQDKAPKNAFFKKTKTEYQEDINEILGEVYSILDDELVNDTRDNIAQIDQEIAETQAKASEKKSKSAVLIGSEKQEALEEYQDYLAEIKEYRKARADMLVNVQVRLSEFGTDLSIDQVEALLVRVNADDILGMTTVFPVIGEMAQTYAEITALSDEDLNNAKKYYSMYVVLLELQLHIQERYMADLKITYLPRLSELETQQKDLIKTTKKEMYQASEKHKEVYALNLKSQQTTLTAIQLYETHMQTDLGNMSQAHDLLVKDYNLAVNTLNTVTMSSQVSSLINDSNQLFDKIMTMQAPELVPFNNIQMQREFSALTQKIKE